MRAAVDLLGEEANFRYEYYQRVDRNGTVRAGSLEVPLIRSERADGSTRFTAEMGVALDFGNDPNTRMNVIGTADTVCLNVPFYERVLGDRDAPPEFVWMIPLIDGWGCIESGRLDGDPDVLSIFGFDAVDRFVAMTLPLVEGRLVEAEAVDHRGRFVRRAIVEVPAALARAMIDARPQLNADPTPAPPSAGASDTVDAVVLLDGTGRLVAVEYSVDLDGSTVHQRLEVFDRDAVEPIELPGDVVDISEPVLELLDSAD